MTIKVFIKRHCCRISLRRSLLTTLFQLLYVACPTGYLKYESRCLRLPRSVITRWDSTADDFDYDQVTIDSIFHCAVRYVLHEIHEPLRFSLKGAWNWYVLVTDRCVFLWALERRGWARGSQRHRGEWAVLRVEHEVCVICCCCVRHKHTGTVQVPESSWGGKTAH